MHVSHRSSSLQNRRRGVAALEAAIVLPVATLILFGALDVALAIQRQNLLTECACRAARLAIVSGEFSTAGLGPATWTGLASDSHAFANAIRPMLPTLKPSSVTIVATWTEGSRDVGKKVQLKLSTQLPSLYAKLFGSTWILTAQSTMLIAN